jgi:glycosyltransferase involved in cell wall biosynthesis
VIHPPVGEKFFGNEVSDTRPQDRNYFLALGRLVPYKRFDLLIEVANRLRLPLKIAGTGSDHKRLEKLAGPTVEMLGHVPDDRITELYASAKAFLFPQIEDAGVAALEAQACGTPVIALGQGGALDTVIDGTTGVFFLKQSADSVAAALQSFENIQWNSQEIRKHAEQFREETFRIKIQNAVKEALEKFQRHS